MKYLKLIMLFAMMVTIKSSYSQLIYPINNAYSTDTIIKLINMPNVYSLNINGQIQLNSDIGFVRVIMKEFSGEKYLVYEGSKLISNSLSITLNNFGEETYSLNCKKPIELEIHLKNASINLFSIYMDTIVNTYKSQNSDAYLNNLFNQKLLNVQNYIQQNQMLWTAGNNLFARMTYSQKTKYFGDPLPDLQGFEYYTGGIFELLPRTTAVQSNYVNNFDWRNRHGANNPNSPYWDGDNTDWSGWITTRHEGQVCNDCWIFSPVYTTESIINLYYNKHLDRNLSEQNLLSCIPRDVHCEGYSPYVALDYMKNNGVVNESCFPYQGDNYIACNTICSNPTEKVYINNYEYVSQYTGNVMNDDNIKKAIIEKGPLSSVVAAWGHAMSLVGYGTIKAGNQYMNQNNYSTIFNVPENSPLIGKTYWIFKQSWGSWIGGTPYVYVITPISQLFSIKTPITSNLLTPNDIRCVDLDGDGYYNWGIGPKPATCPTCPDEEDCDDSNPFLGPYDAQYNCRLLCNNFVYSGTPLEINQNEIWNYDYNSNKDIIIHTGKSLTIEKLLNMVQGAKIIVEPGAKLIVNGGTISNLCGNKWQGIEVWGTKNAAQGSPFYSQYQGIVELKNGATIANAEEAIRLWKPDDWNSMGGIVFANNATFLNNRRSVEFMSYKETLPNGYTVDNESSFTNCTFKVDNNYLDPANDEFTVHVSLWDVKGVKFTACQFLNEMSNKQFSLSNNKAIYSIDAAYYVNSLCSIAMPVGQNCPPENQTRSLFKGFNVAIEATGTNPNPFVKVDEADFKENLKGVRISSLNNSWINRSNFQVGNSSIQNINTNYDITGIDLFNSTGFRVEENNLQASSLPNTTSNGIVVKQSGEAQNQVYKNTIQNLTYGQHYYKLNRSTQESYKGLQFLCNQHQGNAENDVMIEGAGSSSEGIRIYQGRVSSTEEKAAGNTFSNGICNVKNETTIPLIYSCFSQPVQVPDINNCVNNNVFLALLNTENTCPSNFSTGLELPLSAEYKTMLNSSYDQLESAYTNLLYNYNTLIDGGNTNAVLNKIQSTWPQEVWELRNELMSKSPYLTEEVLRETAKRNILPQAMVLEICLANPDGTRNHKFIDFLAGEIPNPLPEYMLALIVDNWETKSTRTLLENTLAEKGAEKDYIANMLIANEQVSENSPKSFIRNWLTRRGNLPDFYARAESLMDENNYSSATDVLSQISTYYKLDEVQQGEFNNFTTYLNFRSSICNSGKSIAQLSKDEIEELKAIAAANTGRSSAIAKNILCFFYGVCFDDDVKTGGYKSRVIGKPTVSARQIINSEYNKVNVMPNPASVYTAFSWELPLLEGEATLTISDVSSKLIEQHTLKTRQGQWIWDTRAIKKGIYLYELKDATGSIAHGKLVISE